jgi:hypothetical protein
MTPPDHAKFYAELLESRLRFLNGQIAKVGRWDDSFNALSAERDAVAYELAGLRDDVGRNSQGPRRGETR